MGRGYSEALARSHREHAEVITRRGRGRRVHRQPQSAEEFYSQTLERLHLLQRHSHGYAEQGDAVGAIASQWAADVVALQSVAWERIVVTSRSGQRSLFDVGERVLATMISGDSTHQVPVDTELGAATAAELVRALRDMILSQADDALADEVAVRWDDLAHLEALPAPRPADLAEHASRRLGELDPVDYVMARRTEARTAMAEARSARVRGDLAGAIEASYRSDMLALDAYLVDSAERLGDSSLLTAQVRWDLAMASVAKVGVVPEDIHQAAATVRSAVEAILGLGEAERLEACWERVD